MANEIIGRYLTQNITLNTNYDHKLLSIHVKCDHISINTFFWEQNKDISCSEEVSNKKLRHVTYTSLSDPKNLILCCHKQLNT